VCSGFVHGGLPELGFSNIKYGFPVGLTSLTSRQQSLPPFDVMPPFPDLVAVILFVALFRLADAECQITGNVCDVPSSTVTGICVPLDANGESEDCYNVYGFLLASPNTCEEQYGQGFANVSSTLLR
jgi:hypothetical protein